MKMMQSITAAVCVKSWEARYAPEPRICTPRVRKVERSAPEARNRVVHALELFGVRVSARRLEDLFDDMARGEVEEIQERYRLWHARRHPSLLETVSWTRPGAVWAMDHAMPPRPVEGIYPAIFALRDLASGFEILCEPVKDAGAAVVADLLEECFVRFGAPLVLKSDSGPAFRSGALGELLGAWGVKHSLSPPRRPQYNGAVEASIRWMKVRTEAEAVAAGRGGAWRRADMHRARRRANTHTRRHKGVAEDVWGARAAITEETRSAFSRAVATEALTVLSERRLLPGRPLPVLTRRAVQRNAIRRALVANGILHFTRRLFPPPIKHTMEDNYGRAIHVDPHRDRTPLLQDFLPFQSGYAKGRTLSRYGCMTVYPIPSPSPRSRSRSKRKTPP